MGADARGDRVTDAVALHDRARDGDVAALAKLLSLTESDPATASAAFWRRPGDAHVIGITGAPGAGKSTLTSALISALRALDKRVAVLAVDPSSPYTGGAILGDRIRMGAHVLDDGVFIRSLATRGRLGGLSAAAPLATRLLESVGFDHVLVETVGVGQGELEIAKYADTVVVVLTPGWGDGIQTNKSGIIEIADVFVVNKADWPGAQDTVTELKLAHSLRVAAHSETVDEVPIVGTIATDGTGVDDLVVALANHRSVLEKNDRELLRERRDAAAQGHVANVIGAEFDEQRRRLMRLPEFRRAASAVAARECDPWAAARDLISSEAAVMNGEANG
jgi:LAO/AO transport system kinase